MRARIAAALRGLADRLDERSVVAPAPPSLDPLILEIRRTNRHLARIEDRLSGVERRPYGGRLRMGD